jgi:tetratricopeptide (TPR) repeat protein
LQEALAFQKAGRLWEAAQSFAKAVRQDRAILREDDHGLVEVLRQGYQAQLERHPRDPVALEGLGFVAAVCDGDPVKGLDYYHRALEAAPDEATRKRLQSYVDHLRATVAAARAAPPTPPPTLTASPPHHDPDPVAPPPPTTASGPSLEERKQELERLSARKGQLEARLESLEDDLKRLEDENDKHRRRYLSSNDRRYKRKEEAGEKAIEEKKQELDRTRREIAELEEQIQRLTQAPPSGRQPVQVQTDSTEETPIPDE